MSEWEKVRLEDVCESISDGDHQPPPKSNAGVAFITISNIDSQNHIDFKDVMHVPQEYYDSLDSKRKARTGDILYSVVGSFGIPVLIKDQHPFVFQRHIAILRPDQEKIVPEFLYYSMLSKDFYQQAGTVAIGAAQRTIGLNSLRNMVITIPDIVVQKCIGEKLSAYDNLIENNNRQIKLLEEAAQRLYQEWFVDLHFPGYEDCKIVDGVPKGWSIKQVSDVGRVVTGKTPATSNAQYYDGDIPFVKIPDMHGVVYPFKTEAKLSKDGADSQKSKFIPKDSIMVSCIATVGLVNISVTDCQTNQQINSLILENSDDLYFMYFTLKRMVTV